MKDEYKKDVCENCKTRFDRTDGACPVCGLCAICGKKDKCTCYRFDHDWD